MEISLKYFKSSSLSLSRLLATAFILAFGITSSCQSSDMKDVKLVRIDNIHRVDVFIGDKLFTSYQYQENTKYIFSGTGNAWIVDHLTTLTAENGNRIFSDFSKEY